MNITQQTMNKKTYSAPKTELVTVAYVSHLLKASTGEDIDIEAKDNFMKPAGGDDNNRGNYNPWSTWDEE